jgi:hypothetical protein
VSGNSETGIAAAPRPRRSLISRHSLITRLTHWINLLCVTVLLMSGLQIFNAHPALYWGNAGANPSEALFEIGAHGPRHTAKGFTRVGATTFDTTGIFGFPAVPPGKKWCADFRDG